MVKAQKEIIIERHGWRTKMVGNKMMERKLCDLSLLRRQALDRSTLTDCSD